MEGLEHIALKYLAEDLMMKELQQLVGNPGYRILNFSNGISLVGVSRGIKNQLGERYDSGLYLYPNLRQAILGPDADNLSEDQQWQGTAAG